MKKTLKVVYILSSTYDDDGYALRFKWGILPSNTLACLKSLTQAVGDSGELGEEVSVEVEIYDDTVQSIPVNRIVRSAKRQGAQLLVGMVGVQTNQIVRAGDIAMRFREHDVPVMIGGFHVSGMLAMFDEPSPDLQRLLDHGITLVRGEAEAPGALAGILRDALAGELKPVYNITEFPDLTTAALPQPDHEYLKHFKCSRDGRLLVEGGAAETLDDPPRHGVGEHARDVFVLEHAHAGGHVLEELDETAAVTHHGHRSEAGILLGSDEQLETRRGHLLDQHAVQAFGPRGHGVVVNPAIGVAYGGLVGEAQEYEPYVGLVDQPGRNPLDHNGIPELFRGGHGIVHRSGRPAEDGDVESGQKLAGFIETDLLGAHRVVSFRGYAQGAGREA